MINKKGNDFRVFYFIFAKRNPACGFYVEFQMGAEQGYSEQQAEYWRDFACERNAFL